MRLQLVAILAALIAGGCSSSDATATTTQKDGNGCAAGEIYCSGCNGGGFCSQGGCPNFQCPAPIPDSGRADDAASGDATIVDAAGCGSSMTSCIDCNGGAFCVSGACPKTTCPARDAGTSGDADANSDATARACDDQTCGVNQFCVHPTCGGGIPTPCSPTNDAGTCPSGWMYQPQCLQLGGGGPKPGCLPPRCTDPPAFCIDIPPTCGAMPMCGCLPIFVCKGHGQCGAIRGSDVVCLAA
jgi:hypothetical protein